MASLMTHAIRWARRLLSLVWLAAMVVVVALAAWSHLAGLIVVAGDSMAPAIPRGSLIQVAAIEADAIRVGDVVTVQADNGVLVTHRVVRLAELPDGKHLELRGDANPAPDPVLVPADAVVGRVALSLPLAGYLIAMLAGVPGLLSIASSLAALLVAIWLLEDIEAATASWSGTTVARLA